MVFSLLHCTVVREMHPVSADRSEAGRWFAPHFEDLPRQQQGLVPPPPPPPPPPPTTPQEVNRVREPRKPSQAGKELPGGLDISQHQQLLKSFLHVPSDF